MLFLAARGIEPATYQSVSAPQGIIMFDSSANFCTIARKPVVSMLERHCGLPRYFVFIVETENRSNSFHKKTNEKVSWNTVQISSDRSIRHRLSDPT
jgi:hypothetical protein